MSLFALSLILFHSGHCLTFSSICLQYSAVKGKYFRIVTIGMTGSSENKFYCADVRSNMSVCPSVSLSPVYLIYPSIHPPTYLHIHASIHPSVRSHDEKRKEKMRILGKSNMRKRCRGLCGVEATAQKLRESVKRHSEFRGVLHNNFNIYRPNTYHIVLNTVIYDYCLPERDNM